MAVFRVEKNKGYTRYEQSPPAKQRTDAKSKGLALTDAFTSGKLGLYPCRTFPYQQRKYRCFNRLNLCNRHISFNAPLISSISSGYTFPVVFVLLAI